MEENYQIEKEGEFGVIRRTIPVGFGGYIIGKKGVLRNALFSEFGAKLYLRNDHLNPTTQIIEIYVQDVHREAVAANIDKKIELLMTNPLRTVTQNPKNLIQFPALGKMIPAVITRIDEQSNVTVLIANKTYNNNYAALQEKLKLDYAHVLPVDGAVADVSTITDIVMPTPIASGAVCVMLNSNFEFHRCVVNSYHGEISNVFCVDTGLNCYVHNSSLFKIKVKFLDLPFRAMFCKWSHAELNKQYAFANQSIQKKFLVRENDRAKMVFVYFTHQSGYTPQVSIYVPSVLNDAQSVDYNDLLQIVSRMGLAKVSDIDVDMNTKLHANDNFFKQPNFHDYEKHVKFDYELNK